MMLGNINSGLSSISVSNGKAGMAGPFVLASPTDFTALMILTDYTITPTNAKGLVYSDSAGSPGSLVAATSVVALTIPQAQAAWTKFPFASTLSLPAGTYWLGIAPETDIVDIWYFGGTAAVGSYKRDDLFSYATPDPTFTVGFTIANRDISIYLTDGRSGLLDNYRYISVGNGMSRSEGAT